jgi:hypothetical protein
MTKGGYSRKRCARFWTVPVRLSIRRRLRYWIGERYGISRGDGGPWIGARGAIVLPAVGNTEEVNILNHRGSTSCKRPLARLARGTLHVNLM